MDKDELVREFIEEYKDDLAKINRVFDIKLKQAGVFWCSGEYIEAYALEQVVLHYLGKEKNSGEKAPLYHNLLWVIAKHCYIDILKKARKANEIAQKTWYNGDIRVVSPSHNKNLKSKKNQDEARMHAKRKKPMIDKTKFGAMGEPRSTDLIDIFLDLEKYEPNPDNKEYILAYFVGGLTYSEISRLKKVSKGKVSGVIRNFLRKISEL